MTSVIINGELVTLSPEEEAVLRTEQETLFAYAPVPQQISRRQFYQELAHRDMITKEEALAAIVTNALPPEFAEMVEAILDEDIQWQARMLLAGATEFKRSNWFVDFFAAMKSLSGEYMDGFWRAGALLD